MSGAWGRLFGCFARMHLLGAGLCGWHLEDIDEDFQRSVEGYGFFAREV